MERVNTVRRMNLCCEIAGGVVAGNAVFAVLCAIALFITLGIMNIAFPLSIVWMTFEVLGMMDTAAFTFVFIYSGTWTAWSRESFADLFGETADVPADGSQRSCVNISSDGTPAASASMNEPSPR